MINNIPLSQEQKQLILGSLLGDGYCNRQRQTLRFGQCEKQKGYLEYKYSFFNADEVRKIYKRTYNEGYISYSFEFPNQNHKYDALYSYIGKYLYSNSGRKKISPTYLSNLTSLGLAFWWMDDGSLCNSKGNRWGKLCTECYNYEEHILIQKYFKEKWNIDAKITKEKDKYYFINFNATALRKLISIIYKHVLEVPCMVYKIDMNYKNNINLGEFQEVYDYIKNKINR